MLPKPRTPAPRLEVETLGGDTWLLADQTTWLMVVFYRGLHCPGCEAYLRQMDREVGTFREVGVELLAVSGDTRERAEQAKRNWKIDNLAIGYGLSLDAMREWGLFVSKGIKEGEPEFFAEPALFVTRPDGSIFYVAVNSMTFGRPRPSEILKALKEHIEKDLPARGEA